MKKKSDYERGFIDALNALEHMARTDIVSQPMLASDYAFNKGVQMVLYDIDVLRRSAKERNKWTERNFDNEVER